MKQDPDGWRWFLIALAAAVAAFILVCLFCFISNWVVRSALIAAVVVFVAVIVRFPPNWYRRMAVATLSGAVVSFTVCGFARIAASLDIAGLVWLKGII